MVHLHEAQAVPPKLCTDIASLGARIAKDLALASDPEQRQQLLTQAARRYREIFNETYDYDVRDAPGRCPSETTETVQYLERRGGHSEKRLSN